MADPETDRRDVNEAEEAWFTAQDELETQQEIFEKQLHEELQ